MYYIFNIFKFQEAYRILLEGLSFVTSYRATSLNSRTESLRTIQPSAHKQTLDCAEVIICAALRQIISLQHFRYDASRHACFARCVSKKRKRKETKRIFLHELNTIVIKRVMVHKSMCEIYIRLATYWDARGNELQKYMMLGMDGTLN